VLHALITVGLLLAQPQQSQDAVKQSQEQGAHIQEPSAPASRAESKPADAAAKRALGAEMLRAGRKAEAIQAFQEAYDSDGSLESGLGWARALLADARFNDSLRALDAIKEHHKKESALHVAFAEAFSARGEARRAEARDRGFDELGVVASEYEGAANSMLDAIECDPKRLDWYFLVTRYFIAAGKAESAIESAAAARKQNPNSWELALCEGDARLADLDAAKLLRLEAGVEEETKKDREERLAAARGAFEEAAKLAPDRAEPSQRLGYLVLATGGDKAKARELYAKAIANDPAKTDLTALLAALSAKELLAFCEAAQRDFKKSHPRVGADSPDDAPILWYLAYAKYLNDDRKAAEEGFRVVAKKTPADMTARYYLGKIAYFDKRYKEATAEFELIAKRSPKELAAIGRGDGMFTPILQGLVGKLIEGEGGGAAVTAVVGNPGLETAIRFQEAIIESDPNNAREWNNLGLFHRDAGHPKQALEAYLKALSLAPKDPRVLNDTAVVYHYYLKTNDAEAKRLYEQAIEIAKEVAASKSASIPAKEDARSALQDAQTNLARLLKGNRKND
jgi:tetratricopeptide (TPR) repeat protein